MEAMLMYHGTVSTYLLPIKMFGLMPSPKNNWKIRGHVGRLHEAHAVYLTASEKHAMSYAESKVAYLATEPGGVFSMYGDLDGRMLKDADAPVVTGAQPVVLVLEVDEHDHRLMSDPEDPVAYEYRGPLPPSAVRDIRQIEMPESVDADPIRSDVAHDEEMFSMLLRRALFSPGGRRDRSPLGAYV